MESLEFKREKASAKKKPKNLNLDSFVCDTFHLEKKIIWASLIANKKSYINS